MNLVSTAVGDCLGIPGDIGFFLMLEWCLALGN